MPPPKKVVRFADMKPSSTPASSTSLTSPSAPTAATSGLAKVGRPSLWRRFPTEVEYISDSHNPMTRERSDVSIPKNSTHDTSSTTPKKVHSHDVDIPARSTPLTSQTITTSPAVARSTPSTTSTTSTPETRVPIVTVAPASRTLTLTETNVSSSSKANALGDCTSQDRQPNRLYFRFKLKNATFDPSEWLTQLREKAQDCEDLFDTDEFSKFDLPTKTEKAEYFVELAGEFFARILHMYLTKRDSESSIDWNGTKVEHCHPLDWEQNPKHSLMQLQLQDDNISYFEHGIRGFKQRFMDYMVAGTGSDVRIEISHDQKIKNKLKIYFNGKSEKKLLKARQFLTLFKLFLNEKQPQIFGFAEYSALYRIHEGFIRRHSGDALPLVPAIKNPKSQVNFKNIANLGDQSEYKKILIPFARRYKINIIEYTIKQTDEALRCAIALATQSDAETFQTRASKDPELSMWKEFFGPALEVTLPGYNR